MKDLDKKWQKLKLKLPVKKQQMNLEMQRQTNCGARNIGETNQPF